MSRRCLGCYGGLEAGAAGDYHAACSRKLFDAGSAPVADFGSEEIKELAKTAISQHLGITGVQPKISVHLEKQRSDSSHRLKIVGFWGNFILKPSSHRFPELAAIEDATMHLASAAGIATARHGLIRLRSGELAYITRRFDRGRRGGKIAVEDFCQLSGLLTEAKYKTSLESAGKIILRHSSNPGLDAIAFLELALFSFLSGNADMHLKNFSPVKNAGGETVLSPAYDLVATALLPIHDPEETALTVNGKKRKLSRDDFVKLGRSLSIQEKAVQNAFTRLEKAFPRVSAKLESSFLPPEMKVRFKRLLKARAARLF